MTEDFCSYCHSRLEPTWEYCPFCKTIYKGWEGSKPIRLQPFRPKEDFTSFIKTIKKVKSPIPAPTKSKRRIILERDGYKCLSCGSKKHLTLDHITPKSLGGGNEDNNLQILCFTCNGEKGSRIIDYRFLKQPII